MSIGIVTHDAASIDVTGEKAVASNRLLFLYDKTKLIVIHRVHILYGQFNLNRCAGLIQFILLCN